MTGVPQHPYQAYQAYQAVQTLPGRSVPRLLRQRVHASVNKRPYYFGLKVSVIVTEAGEPVEMVLVPGSTTDITALRSMDLNLPEGSTLFGDSGFLDRQFESALGEEAGVRLVVPRRSNM